MSNIAPYRKGRLGGAKLIRPKTQQEAEQLPRDAQHVQRGQPFTLFHGHQWELCEVGGTPTWLPELAEIWHTPGCNGVTERGNPAAALTGMQRKQGIVIHNGDPRLPEEFRNYLAAYDIRGGGKHYCLPHVEFAYVNGGRNVIPAHTREWEYAFRQAVYDAGLVPAMDRDVLVSQVAVLQNRADEYTRRERAGALTHDAAEASRKEITDRIEAMESAYDRQFGDAEHGGVRVRGSLVSTSEPAADLDEDAPPMRPSPKRIAKAAKDA